MKILAEYRTLPMITPASKLGDFKLFSYQNGTHSIFDVFDNVKPDVFVHRASAIDRATIKNIKENPSLRLVIINDSQSHVDLLSDQIGDCFVQFPDEEVCSLDECLSATKIHALETGVFCPESFHFSNLLPNWKFEKAKIFSLYSNVNHLFFCGGLAWENRFSGYKSCQYAITEKSEFFNVIMCGAVPIQDDSLAPATNVSKQEIFDKHTNYDFVSRILSSLQMEKESQKVLSIKNKIGEAF